MSPSSERILIVENDPDISDLIARQALRPLGYDVRVVGEAASAIQQAAQAQPDLIVANLNLPGLSGKDLLTALSSQGVNAPLVVVAEKGQEQELVDTFARGKVAEGATLAEAFPLNAALRAEFETWKAQHAH